MTTCFLRAPQMLTNIYYEKLHATNRTHIAWNGIGRLFQAITRHQLHTPHRFRYKRGFTQPVSSHESFPRNSLGSYYQYPKMMLPNKPTAVGAVSSAVHVASRRWLSLFRLKHYAMKSFICNLTPRGEVFLVFAIYFGLGIIMQTIGRHLMPGAPLHGEFSNLGLVALAIYHLLVLALVFLYIGRIRGWSFASFGFQISWKLTGLGVLLFVPAKLFFFLRRMIVSPNTAGLLAAQIALPIIIISSIIIGIFEELMEVGYVIKVTEKYGMRTAVFISALIRTMLHIYQGAAGMACVFVIGVIFGLVYWKLRQLWPLIVAHILIDIIGDLQHAHHAA